MLLLSPLIWKNAGAEVLPSLIHALNDGPPVQLKVVDLAMRSVLFAAEQKATEHKNPVFVKNCRMIGPAEAHRFPD